MRLRHLVSLSFICALPQFVCLLGGCHTDSGPRTASNKSKVTCILDESSVTVGGSRLMFPRDQALTSVAPLVKSLVAESAHSKSEILLLRASADTSANTLLRVLLSAQEAHLKTAYLATSEAWIELALPDSEDIPPMSVADVYFTVSAQQITASRDLASLGDLHFAPNAADNSGPAIKGLLKKNCSPRLPCVHVVMSTNQQLLYREILPLADALSEFRGESGSLRLVLNNDLPVTSPSSREDALLTRALIRETINSAEPSLRLCREKAYESTSAGGMITVNFTVTGLGIVFDAEVIPEKSTIQDKVLHACISNEFLKLKFPKPEGANLKLEHTVRF